MEQYVNALVANILGVLCRFAPQGVIVLNTLRFYEK